MVDPSGADLLDARHALRAGRLVGTVRELDLFLLTRQRQQGAPLVTLRGAPAAELQPLLAQLRGFFLLPRAHLLLDLLPRLQGLFVALGVTLRPPEVAHQGAEHAHVAPLHRCRAGRRRGAPPLPPPLPDAPVALAVSVLRRSCCCCR